jgi:hypothetical protein
LIVAFDFPASPTNGQTYTPAGGPTYTWNGTVWVVAAPSTFPDAPNDANAYVRQALAWVIGYTKAAIDALLALKAPLASPALTGNPTSPTGSAGNSSTLIATTAFVRGEILSQKQVIRTFSNTSGTFTFSLANPIGALVEIFGSGGGGGGVAATAASQGSAGGGGGSGGYLRKWYAAATAQSMTYIAGDGGAGGGSAAAGATGAQSNFGPSLVVTGGGGGGGGAATGVAGTNSYGGASGNGTGGDVNVTGAYGENGQAAPFNFNSSIGAHGAHGMIGNGSLSLVGSSAGNPGSNYQAGGGGGCNGQSQGAAKAGGKGAPALIVVTEYY